MATRILRDVTSSSQANLASIWLLETISQQNLFRSLEPAIAHGVLASFLGGLRYLLGRARGLLWESSLYGSMLLLITLGIG